MSLKNAFSVSYCYDRHFLVFTFSITYQRHVYDARHVRDLNPRDFYIQTVFKTAPSTNRTHGKYSSVVELLYLKLLLPLLCTISYGLSTACGKVHPWRKLAQCVGFEPTRRINARRLSKPFQCRYGNTAKLTRCTRSKATKRIEIFSSVLSELLLLYFLLAAFFIVRFFYNHSHTPVKEYARLSLGLQESNPRQPGYKPCLLPLN